MGMYVLYCLVKDKKPCYVGVTGKNRLRKRISEHKSKKSFDSFVIIKQYKTKKEALIAENSITILNGLFYLGLVNSKFLIDDYYNTILNENQ